MEARINVYDLFTELRKAGDLKILGLKAVQMEEHGKAYVLLPVFVYRLALYSIVQGCLF